MMITKYKNGHALHVAYHGTKLLCNLGNVTHPQLLVGLKCESQTENNGRTRSRNMFPASQHYRGLKGRAGAPGWD
jgi:hypothetical protein